MYIVLISLILSITSFILCYYTIANTYIKHFKNYSTYIKYKIIMLNISGGLFGMIFIIGLTILAAKGSALK